MFADTLIIRTTRLLSVSFHPQKCVRKDEVDSKTLDQKKTLQSSNVSKATNENDEFEKQRIAAIAEVAKSKEVGKVRNNDQGGKSTEKLYLRELRGRCVMIKSESSENYNPVKIKKCTALHFTLHVGFKS